MKGTVNGLHSRAGAILQLMLREDLLAVQDFKAGAGGRSRLACLA